RPLPRSSLFPYTTLFRSWRGCFPCLLVVATLFVSRLFVVCCRTSSLTSRLALATLTALIVERAEAGNALERGFHVVDRDQPRARSEEHTSELQSRFDLVC